MSWSYTNFYDNRFFIAVFGVFAGLSARLSLEWITTKRKMQQMAYEKSKAELISLKNQINPHFLFNALNTIYFQLNESKDSAQQLLVKFSDLLRYQIYDCADEFVLVTQELEYLSNYISLQEIRKGNSCDVNFSFDTSWKKEKIAPLLLITFIENAFKYVSTDSDKQNKIEVSIFKNRDCLDFYCYNSVNGEVAQVQKCGLGIDNVKRRLILIYPERSELSITKTNEYYSVALKIKL